VAGIVVLAAGAALIYGMRRRGAKKEVENRFGDSEMEPFSMNA
jgi:hypothetical protein